MASVPNSSFRKTIVETTNIFMQTLNSYSDVEAAPFSKKGKGVRVEDLINKFKHDA